MSTSGTMDVADLRKIRDPGEMDARKVALITGPYFPDSLRDEVLAKFFMRGAKVEVLTFSDTRVVPAKNNYQETIHRFSSMERLLNSKPFHVLDDATAAKFDFIYHMNYFLHPDGKESLTFCAWSRDENEEMHMRCL